MRTFDASRFCTSPHKPFAQNPHTNPLLKKNQTAFTKIVKMLSRRVGRVRAQLDSAPDPYSLIKQLYACTYVTGRILKPNFSARAGHRPPHSSGFSRVEVLPPTAHQSGSSFIYSRPTRTQAIENRIHPYI